MNFLDLLNIIPESKIITAHNTDLAIKNLSTDSRESFFSENTLFFALTGERRNGHDFISEIIEKGGKNFVVSDEIFIHNFLENNKNITNKINIIKVSNTLNALQKIAQKHRLQFHYPVIAITGSNGKTIIKEWLSEILQQLNFSVVKSPKSYNSQIGVPLSVWQMNDLYNIGVFEAGISEPNEMQNLQEILCPDVCIFSNIGEAHDSGFVSRSQKIQEKLTLSKDAKKIIYNAFHTDITDEIDNVFRKNIETTHISKFPQKITWIDTQKLQNISQKYRKDIKHTIQYFLDFEKDETKKITKITLHHKEKIQFVVPFVDSASLENITHILIFLSEFNLIKNNFSKIQNAIQHLQAVQMRLQRKAGINNCTLIDDTYNNDLEGLKIALDFTQKQQNTSHKRKILVLSEIPIPNMPIDLFGEILSSYIHQYKVNILILIGKIFVENKDVFENLRNPTPAPPQRGGEKLLSSGEDLGFKALPSGEGLGGVQATFEENLGGIKIHFLEKTNDFFVHFSQKDFFQDIILIKGARHFQFEQIVNFLQQKKHRTALEINLNALVHNLNFYKKLLKPNTKLMVMVKAFAYGTGRTEVAQLLQQNGVDYLAVAYTDEAVALREEGISLPIMVMNPTEEDFAQILLYDIEPEIYSFSLLEKWLFYCEITQKEDFKIHLKLDTGMKRLGFESADIEKLGNYLLKNLPKNAQIKSIFTHLAGADEATHNVFSQKQIDFFSKNANYLKDILQKINPKTASPLFHVLNSPGIVRFPEAHFDMVRLGIGLYGVETNQIFANQLQPIATLKTYISQIKFLPKGESVGYSRTHFAQNDTKIATIAIGYADGFNRLLSNGVGEVWIKNKICKIVGRVCMDMCMVEIGDLEVQEGEEVEIFGKHISIESIAQKTNTIPYEVLTSVGERVKRVFFSE